MLNSIPEQPKTSYFHDNNLAKLPTSPFSKLKKKKLLPHIQEQYSYRITNRLLVHKIMHPKRDKNITDSLINTSLNHSHTNQSQRSQLLSNSVSNMQSKRKMRNHRTLFKPQNSHTNTSTNKNQLNSYHQGFEQSAAHFYGQNNEIQDFSTSKSGFYGKNIRKFAGKILKNNFLSCENKGELKRGLIVKNRSLVDKEEFLLFQTDTSNSKSILMRTPKAKPNVISSIQIDS